MSNPFQVGDVISFKGIIESVRLPATAISSYYIKMDDGYTCCISGKQLTLVSRPKKKVKKWQWYYAVKNSDSPTGITYICTDEPYSLKEVICLDWYVYSKNLGCSPSPKLESEIEVEE